jgi:hypothetical protein
MLEQFFPDVYCVFWETPDGQRNAAFTQDEEFLRDAERRAIAESTGQVS